MKKIIYKSIIAAFILSTFVIYGCKDEFLEIPAKGALSQGVLATADGVDGLLIGAYSLMDGTANYSDQYQWHATTSNWVYGSIRGLEANKGSDSGDQPDINPIQTYSETPTNLFLNRKWQMAYESISRCNQTISLAQIALDAGTITQEQYDLFVKQARTLRGFYHFDIWRMFDGMIPYVDENTDINTVTNTVDVTSFILADLEAGTTLPKDMGQVGRFNSTVAKVFLAEAYMQMNHDFASAMPLLQDVIDNGTKPNGEPIGLEPHYGDIFSIAERNGLESVYTVQYSVNDGSGGYNGGYGEVLNFPYKGGGGSPGGCCGFFIPTQEFVNSFRTSGGLPLLDHSYNDDPVLNDQGLTPDNDSYVEDPGPLDPRLDWTVGRRGIPYLDWGDHTGQDWIRDQAYSGPFSPKKQVYRKSQEGTFTEVGNWTSGWTANGYRMIRFSDVVLRLAECQAQTSTGDMGLALVNQVRMRAADPAGFVKNDNGTNAANYVINPYPSFASQQEALDAILMERKLELGMEGHRYFDLIRWGKDFAVQELSRALTYEKTLRSVLYGNATVGPEDSSYPVPQRQIDLSRGNIVQNR